MINGITKILDQKDLKMMRNNIRIEVEEGEKKKDENEG